MLLRCRPANHEPGHHDWLGRIYVCGGGFDGAAIEVQPRVHCWAAVLIYNAVFTYGADYVHGAMGVHGGEASHDRLPLIGAIHYTITLQGFCMHSGCNMGATSPTTNPQTNHWQLS